MTGPVSVKKYQNLLNRARNIPMLLAEEPQIESVVLDGGQAYCICGGLSDGRFMIACEYSSPQCKQWYHAECVGVPVPETHITSPGENVAATIRSRLRTNHLMNSDNAEISAPDTSLQEEIEQEDFKCPVCARARNESYKYNSALPQESATLLKQCLGPDSVDSSEKKNADLSTSSNLPTKQIRECYAASQGVGVNTAPAHPQPYCFLPLSVGMSETANRKSRMTFDNVSGSDGSNERIVMALPLNNTWLSSCVVPEDGSVSTLQRLYGLVPNTKKFSEQLRHALKGVDPSSTQNNLIDVDIYSDSALVHGIRSLRHEPSFTEFVPSDQSKLYDELAASAKSRKETVLWVAGTNSYNEQTPSTAAQDAINDSIQQGIIEYIYHVGGAAAALTYCQGLQQSRQSATKRGSSEADETRASAATERPKRRRLS
jgi:hypothetical protein